jgi:predicted RNA-binding Zn-ribbon protein involved in translation (DUF1610 family)
MTTPVDWSDPEAEVVDGFTVADLRHMVFDSIARAVCTECNAEHTVEPDAENYPCAECGAAASVTSPLRKAGLI